MSIVMPPRIARLPRDPRDLPIPWNVLRGDAGEAFFTVNDDRLAWRALREQLCPLCGERLGKWRWFVGGPRSAFHEHGWYLDLPGHKECMTFALQSCPYLALPRYMGRIDVVRPEKLPPEARILLNETVIADRPEVFVAVGADRIEAQGGRLGVVPYLRPLRPALAYEYWRHGKQLTEAEAMPYLRAAMGEEWTVPAVAE